MRKGVVGEVREGRGGLQRGAGGGMGREGRGGPRGGLRLTEKTRSGCPLARMLVS